MLTNHPHTRSSPRQLACWVGLAVLAAAACRDGGATSRKPSRPAPGVAATVNGAPITEAELAAAMAAAGASNPHDDTPRPPPARDAVLSELIDQELAAQRAAADGLDRDPDYLAELHRLEVQVAAFRRQRLGLLLEHHTAEQVTIDEAAARRYFDEQGDRMRTVVRVWQILVRDHATAEALRREIEAGAPFEEVAKRAIPGAAELAHGAPPPWELGELQWSQIPEPWLGVIDTLPIDTVSPVIDGPRGRAWVLMVKERHVDPSITFESARPIIVQRLRLQAVAKSRAELTRLLRSKARIELAPAPPAPPAAPHGGSGSGSGARTEE